MALTEEQLQQRKAGIGSSEISMIMGNSPFGTAFDLWAEKVKHITREGNAFTEAGQIFEDAIARWFEKSMEGIRVQPNRITVAHPERPWQLSTVDYYAVTGRGRSFRRKSIVEIKLVNNRDMSIGFGEEGTDDIPLHIIDQVQWQLDTERGQPTPGSKDIDHAFVVAWVMGRGRTYRIAYDQEYAELLRERARAFWFDYVVTGKEPEIDGSEGAQRWLAMQYPTHSEELQPATDQDYELARRYELLGAMKKWADEQQEVVKQILEQRIGAGAGITGGDGGWGSVTWKYARSGKYKHGDLAERLYKHLRDVLAIVKPDQLPEELRRLPDWETLLSAYELPGGRRFRLSLSKKYAARLKEERTVHYQQPDGALACPYDGDLAKRVTFIDLVNCDDCRANAARRLA